MPKTDFDPGLRGEDKVQESLERIFQNLIQIVQMVNIIDLIDIAIVSYLIYHVLMFIRRSRSGQVAKAIGLILFALVVSSVAKLRVISFMLNGAVELGLIALLIIFQPELRRFLEQIGSGKLKEIFTSEEKPAEQEAAILQIVDAYTALSRDKVGALIVFERKTLLDDVIKTGTSLDCAVSSVLLKNLFWDKAPLHDGAIIVRSGRIVGAGCMLPLSGNANLSRDLGMRHRAGIGISENSDAVVAIVSEETGSISVAINGMLKRHLSVETLERLLRNELLNDEENNEGNVKLTSRFRKKGDKADDKKTSGQ